MRTPHLARKEGSIKPLSLHGWTIVLDARSKVGCQRGTRWAGSAVAAAPASPASADSPAAVKAAAPAAGRAVTPILCLALRHLSTRRVRLLSRSRAHVQAPAGVPSFDSSCIVRASIVAVNLPPSNPGRTRRTLLSSREPCQ